MNVRASRSVNGAWHIFRKDLRLVWPVAAAAAILQALLGILMFRSQPYASNHFEGLAAVLTLGLAVSITLVIVLSVQQDSLPGVDQDWLVRPIKRRDLLLAKVLAVGLLVHGPIVAVQLLKGLGEGFPPGQMLWATCVSSLDIALVFSLPVMAVAALSKSVTEALLLALALLFALMLGRFLLLLLLFPVNHSFHFSDPTDATGIAWIWQFLAHTLLLLATISVLLLQYLRRCTPVSRLLLFAGLLLFMLVPSLSWQPAFAFQLMLTPTSTAGGTVALSLDPQPRAGTGYAETRLLVSNSEDKDKNPPVDRSTSVLLPLQIIGLQQGAILHADHTVIRFRRVDGTLLYEGIGHVFDVRSSGSDGTATLAQVVDVPSGVRAQLQDQTLRLELDYSLTVLQPRTMARLLALDGDLRSPVFGHCASRRDPGGSGLEVACLKPGVLPPCLSLMLERATEPSGVEKFDCTLNYQPHGLRFTEEPIDHSSNVLPLADPTVSLSDAHVVVRLYEADDHMSRRLVVAQFRLPD